MPRGKKHSASPKSPRDPKPQTTPQHEHADPVLSLVKIGIGTLLITRFLVPTEGPDEGSTLWIAQLWLGLAVVWSAGRIRVGQYDFRWNWIDTCVWVIVLGHVVSAMSVLADDGNQRAAVNMMWEWVSIGTAFFLLRQELVPLDRRRLAAILICVGGSLAVLGIWQHHVSMRATADEFVQQLEEMDTLAERISSGNAGVAEQRRLAQLTYYFGVNGIPTHGPGRARALNRIQDSREPMGMFALANTLAACLLVGWFLAADWARSGTGRDRAIRWLVCGVIGYGLLLTKSRTAWVGMAVGLVWWWLQTRAARCRAATDSESGTDVAVAGSKRWIAVGIVVLAVFVGVAGVSGGLDSQVLTEAPKSLKYRVQYWTGTLLALQDSPVIGLGLGNFRERYVLHKLPESSEEISDPHNLLLDAWANGGLLSLFGLMALLAVLAMRVRKHRHTRESAPDAASTANDNSTVGGHQLMYGGVLGPLLILTLDFSLGATLDSRQLVIGGGMFFGMIWVWTRCRALSKIAIGSASVALVLHLCGAGGFGMPAIAMLAGVLLCLSNFRDESPRSLHPLALPAMMGVFVALTTACYATATRPHLQANALEMHAMADLSVGNLQQATVRLKAAAEADPLSPRALFRLAETLFLYSSTNRTMSTNPGDAIAPLDDAQFDDAVKMAELALERDPLSSSLPRRIGQWYLIRASALEVGNSTASATGSQSSVRPKSVRPKSPSDSNVVPHPERTKQRLATRQVAVERAIHFFARATEHYPNHSALRADYAEALSLAGQTESAVQQAARALELDAINRSEGHSDKFLPEASVEHMQAIANRRPRTADRFDRFQH
ncbi:MAG: O-antigen ligase family protein [Planctomycetota bacterium]|nr:O-antigen ligase family protein [Planctomycetota bacterium]